MGLRLEETSGAHGTIEGIIRMLRLVVLCSVRMGQRVG